MTSHSPLLSHVTHAGYALSPRLARPRLLVGAWLEPRPASRYTGSFGAWLEPRPRGLGVSSCGWSRSTPLSPTHTATLSPRLARPRFLVGAWLEPRPASRYTGSFGAWLEPRPRGLGVSSCGWSRSSKPLAASPHFARLASPRSPRLARLASLALDSPRSTRLAPPSPRLPARLALPRSPRLASSLARLASSLA